MAEMAGPCFWEVKVEGEDCGDVLDDFFIAFSVRSSAVLMMSGVVLVIFRRCWPVADCHAGGRLVISEDLRYFTGGKNTFVVIFIDHFLQAAHATFNAAEKLIDVLVTDHPTGTIDAALDGAGIALGFLRKHSDTGINHRAHDAATFGSDLLFEPVGILVEHPCTQHNSCDNRSSERHADS